MEIELSSVDKQFIRNHKDLIDEGNWDEFFIECFQVPNISMLSVYQFLMFEAGIDLLHEMTRIPDYVFQGNLYNLGDLVIPGNIKELGVSVFSSCGTLTSIDFSRTNIDCISEWCFYHCDNLKKVVLPKTCVTIGPYAFQNCSSLKSINLDRVIDIWEGSFSWCYKLDSIKLNKSVKLHWGVENIFCGCHLKNIVTPEEYVEDFKKEFPNANIKVI